MYVEFELWLEQQPLAIYGLGSSGSKVLDRNNAFSNNVSFGSIL
jgi:hypothetical protein